MHAVINSVLSVKMAQLCCRAWSVIHKNVMLQLNLKVIVHSKEEHSVIYPHVNPNCLCGTQKKIQYFGGKMFLCLQKKEQVVLCDLNDYRIVILGG